MHIQRVAVVAVGSLVLLGAAPAQAGEADEWEAPQAKAEVRERDPSWQWELTMGFMGGVLDPSLLPLVFQEGSASAVPGATGLVAPFGGPSVRSLITAGPAWEARVVQQHVRFTAGLQRPFAQFRQGALDVDLGGLQVSPRALSLWVVRFGLGGEYRLGRVTPFADLLGDVALASADLTVGGEQGVYRSSSFGFSVRAGARLAVNESLSIGLAGEYGLLGAPRFGATLLVGWVIPVR